MKRSDLLTVNPQPGLTCETVKGKPKYRLNGKDLTSITGILSVIDKPALKFWAADCAADYVVAEADRLVAETKMSVLNADDVKEIANNSRRAFLTAGRRAADAGSIAADWFEEHVLAARVGSRLVPFPTLESLALAPEFSDVLKAALATIDAFLDWEMSHDVQWLEAEWPMADEETGIFCREDQFALVDGRPFFVNEKTSKEGKVYPEQALQISAPVMIARQMGLLKLKAGSGVAPIDPREIGRLLLALPKEGGEPIAYEVNAELGARWADENKQKEPVNVDIENCWEVIKAFKIGRAYIPRRY